MNHQKINTTNLFHEQWLSALCSADTKRLFFYTIAHAVVDGICAVTVLHDAALFSASELIYFLIIYNFMAFATQPLVGLFVDDAKQVKNIVLLSLIMLFGGFIIPMPKVLHVILVGIANSIFHVAAGTEILYQSKNNMAQNGVFVSSGSIGLVIGMLFSSNIIVQITFSLLLFFVFIGILMLETMTLKKQESTGERVPYIIPLCLLFCISIRSFMGFAQSVSFEGIQYLPLIFACFVFSGKFIGGFLCDKFTTKRVILVSVPLAALFCFIGKYHFLLWGLSLFCVNISMPITLCLLYQSMKNRPAFSFELAASFLLPGLVLALLTKGQIPDFVFFAILFLNLILLLLGNQAIKKVLKKFSCSPSN